MSFADTIQIAIYFLLLIALGAPLGSYMARVYEDKATAAKRIFGGIESIIYKVASIDPAAEMTWRHYAVCAMSFSAIGLFCCYLVQRLQNVLPLNPQALPAVSADCALNTAISFVTNTNWQSYGGETTMSYLSQMVALTVQNFVSAATGMAVLVALIKGFTRQQAEHIGNFWFDLTRSTIYILMPLSVVLAILLVSQGVVQNFDHAKSNTALEPAKDVISVAMGPAASQVAIKQLGTNGGGYFNVNSSHPLENPTPLSNLLEMLALLLIPVGLCFTFGEMVRDKRQGIALLAAMSAIFVVALWCCYSSEIGNMEGKEVRFGVVNSALWAVATTAASNGSVNSMHDSFTALGGLVPMLLMQLGEVIYGGVGSGLYGMIVFAIIAVFIAGLMVGRTPEYLGKKIESFEMKMASLVILIPPVLVLAGTAIAVSLKLGTSSIFNPGPHGFSEVLYAFSSAGNNNGSAFAGLNANVPFYNYALGICMWFARFYLLIPVLAMAGSLARKKNVPTSLGTLPSHTPLFVTLLVGVVIIFGALTFVPALALGPIVEHLQSVTKS